MSDRSKKITEFTENIQPSNTDVLLIVSNTSGNSVTQKVQVVNLRKLPVLSTPANSSALTIQQGSAFIDGSYLYIATGNNVLKRVSLSSF